MREITIAELKEQSKESYQLIDIRDEGSTVYGMIPGAICIPIKQLMENLDGCVNRIKNNAKVVIYCQRGEKSRDIAERLEEMGLDCYSLAGGCNKIALGHHYDDVIETHNPADSYPDALPCREAAMLSSDRYMLSHWT